MILQSVVKRFKAVKNEYSLFKKIRQFVFKYTEIFLSIFESF